MIGAKILLDSVNEFGNRLTTMEVTFPRIVLAEFNTHRMFSRNSASSRAIPVEKQLKMVMENPFIPLYWGKNQRGMVAEQELELHEQEAARRSWLDARDKAVAMAKQLLEIGVHKQITNRLLEPFMYHTVIVTATEWSNFFALRCHPEAQPEIRTAAVAMREALHNSTPRVLRAGEWHLPLVTGFDREQLEAEGFDSMALRKISSGRLCRVSYLTHTGTRDPQADIDLHDRLVGNGHMSPLEHPAMAVRGQDFHGNFKGWLQYRKLIPFEYDFGAKMGA